MKIGKQALEPLGKPEVILKAFLDHLPGAAFIRDSHSKYLHINKRFRKLFGPESKWIGKTPEVIFPDEFARKMIEEDKKALKNGYNIYDKTLKLEGGIETVFEIHSFRIDRENQEPLIGGIAIDTTDWHASKQTIRESEERYRTVFQNTGSATVIVDSEMTILMANRGFERLSGFCLDDISGKKKWTEFVAPDDLKVMMEYHRERRNRKRFAPNEYEFEFIDKNGIHKDVHLLVDLIPGTNRSVCSLVDISELKNTHAKLKRSIQKRESLLRTMPDLMFVFTRDGEYVEYWAETESELAIPSEILIGSNFSELDLSEEKIHEILDCINKTLETGEIQSVEYELNIQSEHRFFEARISQYGEDNVIAVVRDITARKEAESKRLELENRIHHTQKLESLGVLAGGIAHDFNNILMAILGNADLALNSVPHTNPARSSINAIISAATAAADLAAQMLAYSGKSSIEIVPLDLNKIVVELTHMLEVSISKKVVLRFRLSDELPIIMADATQIRQILMNLITNASEAIGDANGVISITSGAMYCDSKYFSTTELSQDIDEAMYVYIEVSDTGCGMKESVRKQLFEPFYTTKSSGRGLGLSSILGIIRAHSGAIKVYSEPGEGSSFKVLFPVCDPDYMNKLDTGEGNMEERWVGEGLVLFADDEDTVLAVGKKMLEYLGFTVLQASDGREAIEQFKRNADEITLVILDLTMPHLSGDEVYREIRRIRADIPVIISSGFSKQDIKHRFAGKKLSGYIQKPYRIDDLVTIIREVLCEESSE